MNVPVDWERMNVALDWFGFCVTFGVLLCGVWTLCARWVRTERRSRRDP